MASLVPFFDAPDGRMTERRQRLGAYLRTVLQEASRGKMRCQLEIAALLAQRRNLRQPAYELHQSAASLLNDPSREAAPHKSGQTTRSWHLDELRQGETSFESTISLLG
jgi:hypothetical protein